MKSTIYTFLAFFLTFLSISLNAQTLVNKAWVDTTGHPNLTLGLQIATKDANGDLIIGGNTYEADSEFALLTKYSPTGTVLWQDLIAQGSTKRAIGTHFATFKNDLYMTAADYDSGTSTA
jgi:hypothetical protein